jgi:hypothetical protein
MRLLNKQCRRIVVFVVDARSKTNPQKSRLNFPLRRSQYNPTAISSCPKANMCGRPLNLCTKCGNIEPIHENDFPCPAAVERGSQCNQKIDTLINPAVKLECPPCAGTAAYPLVLDPFGSRARIGRPALKIPDLSTLITDEQTPTITIMPSTPKR